MKPVVCAFILLQFFYLFFVSPPYRALHAECLGNGTCVFEPDATYRYRRLRSLNHGAELVEDSRAHPAPHASLVTLAVNWCTRGTPLQEPIAIEQAELQELQEINEELVKAHEQAGGAAAAVADVGGAVDGDWGAAPSVRPGLVPVDGRAVGPASRVLLALGVVVKPTNVGGVLAHIASADKFTYNPVTRRPCSEDEARVIMEKSVTWQVQQVTRNEARIQARAVAAAAAVDDKDDPMGPVDEDVDDDGNGQAVVAHPDDNIARRVAVLEVGDDEEVAEEKGHASADDHMDLDDAEALRALPGRGRPRGVTGQPRPLNRALTAAGLGQACNGKLHLLSPALGPAGVSVVVECLLKGHCLPDPHMPVLVHLLNFLLAHLDVYWLDMTRGKEEAPECVPHVLQSQMLALCWYLHAQGETDPHTVATQPMTKYFKKKFIESGGLVPPRWARRYFQSEIAALMTKPTLIAGGDDARAAMASSSVQPLPVLAVSTANTLAQACLAGHYKVYPTPKNYHEVGLLAPFLTHGVIVAMLLPLLSGVPDLGAIAGGEFLKPIIGPQQDATDACRLLSRALVIYGSQQPTESKFVDADLLDAASPALRLLVKHVLLPLVRADAALRVCACFFFFFFFFLSLC